MRSISALAALSVIGLAAAQPSQHRGHARMHEAPMKRQEADVVITEYAYVTEMVASVTVYVDEFGNTLSVDGPTATPTTTTTTSKTRKSKTTPSTTLATSTTTPPPVTTTSTTTTTPPPTTTSTVVTTAAPETTTSVVAPVIAAVSSAAATTASSSAAAAVASASSSDPTSLKGIAYSPYSGTYNVNVNCKSTSQVAEDIAQISTSSYNTLRIYGTDCNQVANVLAAAVPRGFKIFAGVYEPTNWKAEIDIMSAAVGGDWSAIHTISIGNEAVHKGMSADTLLSALSSSKTYLKSLGYTGYVVAVDTFMVAKSDPRMCQQSDYTAVNMHPYWDYNTAAADAGSWMLTQIAELKSSSLCGSSKPFFISETGWPTAGNTLGKAVASTANQASALSSIRSALGSGYVFLSAFDDWWKDPGTDGVEQMFGIYGTAPSG